MKLIITMKLADRSLQHHIYPITLIDEIDKIIIIRDRKGPEMNKVEYQYPPGWALKSPILTFLFKSLLLLKLSLKEDQAVLHAYLLYPHGILAFIVGKLTKRRVGISLIAGPVELYTLGGSPINRYDYSRPLPKMGVVGRVLLLVLERFDYVTVTGSFTKSFLLKEGIEGKRIFILPHVVDYRFCPKNTKKIYDILYAGRLAPIKHVDILLNALAVAKIGNPLIKAVIVGDGECKKKLEKLSQTCGLTENLIFTGYKKDVWSWFNKSKISVCTSEREGFPYTIIESLSCGVPVIASNCGDVSDVVKDGYNGILINDYQNYLSFAKAINELLTHPAELDELAANSLETVQRITLKKVISVWEEILLVGDI